MFSCAKFELLLEIKLKEKLSRENHRKEKIILMEYLF
jgi:hypothetical protein